MSIQKKYFVGKNKPGVWASVYAYKPNDDEIFQKRGEIFAATIIEGPKEFDSSVAGNLILDILHEAYFESEADSVMEALEESVKASKNRLLSLVENDENAAISGIDFTLVTLVLKDSYFYSVRIGEASVKVFRQGSLQDLAAGYRDPTGEHNYQVLSGVLEAGDVYLLQTPAVDELYTPEELLESTTDYSELVLKNKMLEDDSKVASLLVGVDINEQKEESSMATGSVQSGNIDLDEQEEEREDKIEEGQEGAQSYTQRKFSFEQFKNNAIEKIVGISAAAKDSLNNLLKKNKDTQNSSQEEAVDSKEVEEVSLKEKVLPDINNDSTFVVYIKRAFGRVWIWLKKLGLFIKEDILAIKGDSGLYLKNGRTRSINYRVFAAIAVVLVVIIYVVFNIRQNAVEQKRIEREAKVLINEIETDLDEIENSSVFTINSPDNISARESVLANITTLESKIKESDNLGDEYTSQLNEYSDKLASLRLELLRQISFSDVDIVSDLGANYEGADPSDITVHDGKVYVTDIARNAIYEIDPSGGQRELVSGDLTAPRLLDSDPGTDNLVFVDSSSTALGLVDVTTGSIQRFPGMSDSKFGGAVEMDAYTVTDSDIRLYLAYADDPFIQQVNRNGGAYNSGPQSRWSGADYAGITDVSLLDGKFIVMQQGAGLQRLFVDSIITTKVNGLLGDDNITSADKLATDALYIYVADSANQRVLVFTKSRGENVDLVDLVAQYKYAGSDSIFSNIKDISVDANNIYVLDGAKVIKLPKSEFGKFVY